MHHYGKRRKWFLLIPVFIISIAVLMGFLVMFLWNSILPAVLGVHILTYWQALGLLVLSRILFGGFHRGGFRRRGPFMGKEKWMNMSDEEKSKFREEWKRRCGGRFAYQPAGTKEQQTEQY